MKKNLRLRVIPSQLVVIEDVIDWNVDAIGLSGSYQEVSVTGSGDTEKREILVKKFWYNSAGLLNVQEEYSK